MPVAEKRMRSAVGKACRQKKVKFWTHVLLLEPRHGSVPAVACSLRSSQCCYRRTLDSRLESRGHSSALTGGQRTKQPHEKPGSSQCSRGHGCAGAGGRGKEERPVTATHDLTVATLVNLPVSHLSKHCCVHGRIEPGASPPSTKGISGCCAACAVKWFCSVSTCSPTAPRPCTTQQSLGRMLRGILQAC